MVEIFSEDMQQELIKQIRSIVSESVELKVKKEERYMKSAAACKYLGGITMPTLNKLRRQGLKEIHVGSILLFDKEDIDEFVLSIKRSPEGKTWSNR